MKLEAKLTENCASIVGEDRDKRRSQILCSPRCLSKAQFLQWWKPKKTRKPAPPLQKTPLTDIRLHSICCILQHFCLKIAP